MQPEAPLRRWRAFYSEAALSSAADDTVVGLNLARRHLNTTQHAWIACNCIEIFRKRAHERHGMRTDIMENLPESDFGTARDQAGKAFHVSGHPKENLPEGDQGQARLERDSQSELLVKIGGRLTG
jgi:hypothetical protein